jgi:hypothetical protein
MIRKYGLLSTAGLVELFEVPEPTRTELLTTQRRKSVSISHPRHGTAVLRDQKPLSAKNLARCLVDCDARSWYSLLNERVFFWLCRDRLMTMMSAAEYRGKAHTVMHIETKPLVQRYQRAIELAHMNTGNTRPFPHPRGRQTFRSLDDYDYGRRRRLADDLAVVELTVIGGVPDIRRDVIRVEHGTSQNGSYRTNEVLLRS